MDDEEKKHKLLGAAKMHEWEKAIEPVHYFDLKQ